MTDERGVTAGVPVSGAAGGTPHRRRRFLQRRFLFVYLGLFVAFIAGALWLWFSVRVSRLGVVEEGKLYRCGQPGRASLRVLRALYGIRTVINLRQPHRIAEDKRAIEEQEFLRENGMKFVNLPLHDHNIEEIAEQFLEVVTDPENQPVLVHCAHGRERAGLMSAIYRRAVNGWTTEEALREMRDYGFRLEKYRRAQRFIEEYTPPVSEASNDPAPAPAVPAPANATSPSSS